MNEIRLHQDDSGRRLTSVEFQQLTAMPAAADWFANIDNPRTRRAYQTDLEDFCGFVALASLFFTCRLRESPNKSPNVMKYA